MVKGLRVVFSPNSASGMLYSYRVPEARARGIITAARIGGSVRTYVPGAGPVVHVERERDGLVSAVSLPDPKLEADEDERRR